MSCGLLAAEQPLRGSAGWGGGGCSGGVPHCGEAAVPESFRSSAVVDMTWVMLSRPSHLNVVGRKEEVQRVLQGLTGDAGAAVLVGGPGEGKSMVAMEAGLELCRSGWFPGEAFVIDFAGALPPWTAASQSLSSFPHGAVLLQPFMQAESHVHRQHGMQYSEPSALLVGVWSCNRLARSSP
jgi:hypothetical protein